MSATPRTDAVDELCEGAHSRDNYSAMLNHAPELETELAELRKDKSRLDFVIAHAEIWNPANSSESWDTRAAIDAAIESTKGNP